MFNMGIDCLKKLLYTLIVASKLVTKLNKKRGIKK